MFRQKDCKIKPDLRVPWENFDIILNNKRKADALTKAEKTKFIRMR